MITLDNGQAYLALPEAKQGVEQGAGVLLLHAWWGLTDFFKALADRLAAEGFVVLAPDLYNGETAATIQEAERLSQQFESDSDRMIAQIDSAIDFLTVHPAVTSDGLGLVGFSMGANWGLYTAHHQPEAIAAVVVFYGTYGGNLSQMRADFQGHFAQNDDFEPLEGVAQFEKTLVDMGLETNLFIYEGAGHWFFETDRPAYQAESAQLAWDRTVKFLHDKLDTSD
jgi:carboxymethylenebutenolidase